MKKFDVEKVMANLSVVTEHADGRREVHTGLIEEALCEAFEAGRELSLEENAKLKDRNAGLCGALEFAKAQFGVVEYCLKESPDSLCPKTIGVVKDALERVLRKESENK